MNSWLRIQGSAIVVSNLGRRSASGVDIWGGADGCVLTSRVPAECILQMLTFLPGRTMFEVPSAEPEGNRLNWCDDSDPELSAGSSPHHHGWADRCTSIGVSENEGHLLLGSL